MPISNFKSQIEPEPRRGKAASRGLSSTLHFALLTSHFALSFLLSPGLASAADEKLIDLPLAVRPYRVRLLVAFDAPQLAASARQDVLDETQRAAHRCIGEMWQLETEQIEWLQPVSAQGLSRVEPARLVELAGNDAVDVWFVAVVRAARPGYRIDVRSWQPALQLATESVGLHAVDPRELPLSILKLCHLTFRPSGVVEHVDGKTVSVRLQAGSLVPPDEAFALARSGDTFAVWLASRNREQQIEKMQPIPWTYPSTTEIDGARMTCQLSSGLRSPIGGKQRGRIDTLAIAVRPQFAATRLELATQTRPSLPLVAHRVVLRSSPTTPRSDQAAEPDEHLLGEFITDRRGLFDVAVDRDRPLVWLFAYSGQHLLARVPFMPGSVPSVRLEVPDDSTRLAAEADVQMLQGQLIDAVAARNTLFATIRSAAKKSDWKQVNSKLTDDLPTLPTAQTFLEQLTAIRVPAVKSAKDRKDRAAEARINRLCDEMAELIKQYLNEEKLKVLQDEMKELQKVEAAEAEKDAKP